MQTRLMSTLSKGFAASALALMIAMTGHAQNRDEVGGTDQSAVEHASVKFYISSSLKGNAVVRECPTCDPLRLKVNPQMIVVDADVSNQPMVWGSSLNLGKRKADILYITETKEITNVTIYTSD